MRILDSGRYAPRSGDLGCFDQCANSIVSMSQGLPSGAGIGLALLLCVTGCTPSPTDSSGSAPQVPIHTLIFQDFEVSWQTALPSAAVRDQISEALKPIGLAALLPTAVPSDWADPRGRLLVMRAAPSGAITISVVTESSNGLLSVSGAAGGVDICEERLASGLESGVEWDPIEVRRIDGCGAVNEVGLLFLEWEEAGYRFHVEGTMPLDQTVEWLETWELVP